LAGSGFGAQQARIGGDIASQMQEAILRGEVGAAEAAQARRMGALGLNLQGQGLAAQTAQGLGGLENQLSGQQLQALLGGGQLAGQQGGMDLQAMLGAGDLATSMDKLGFAGQQAQMAGGQDFLNLLPALAQSGAFQGAAQPMGAEAIAHYINRIGMAENQATRNNPYFQMMQYMQNPTRPSSPAAPAGGGGGATAGPKKSTHPKWIGYGWVGGRAIPKWRDAGGREFVTLESPTSKTPAGEKKFWEERGGYRGGGAGPKAPSEERFKGKYEPATFTPPGQPMPAHPAAASPTGGSYADWQKQWDLYSQQFADPSKYTAGGYTA
jgi:hypothetical protein